MLYKIKNLKNTSILNKFIRHNKKIFIANNKGQSKKTPVVLFELNNMQSAHIAYSYLSNVLASEYGAKIIAYVPTMYSNRWNRLVFEIKKLLGLQEFGVYKSFATANFEAIKITESQREKSRDLYSAIIMNLNDKWDIEKITINGIYLGDLFYDSYLRWYNKPTIDKECIDFQHFLQKSIETYVYWEDYFDSHDVRAVNVSHCVYNLAIPLRMAIARDIPAFQVNATHLYRMNKNNYFAYSDYLYFPALYASLPEVIKKAGIAEAKQRIEQRFAGEVGVDMSYSTKSAYVAPHHARLLQHTPRKKILIATHCFFDSPHSYGNNIFPDFYEWLDFLGKMTVVTDYDWYIKMHPDYLPGTKEIIDDFIVRYPKFKLLPADASHHQIIAEGIDLALTVYGTIGFEYAALGVPVINCSLCNPHIAYNFNMHPKSVEEYRQLLLNLDSLSFEIDKRQVYEYYYMKNIYNSSDLFFNSYEDTVKELGGYMAQFTDAVYEKWMEEWTPNKHQSITSAIQAYIRSDDFRMDSKYLGRDSATQFTALSS
jgi:hypothetical protein